MIYGTMHQQIFQVNANRAVPPYFVDVNTGKCYQTIHEAATACYGEPTLTPATPMAPPPAPEPEIIPEPVRAITAEEAIDLLEVTVAVFKATVLVKYASDLPVLKLLLAGEMADQNRGGMKLAIQNAIDKLEPNI
jgi:hypothetical protein